MALVTKLTTTTQAVADNTTAVATDAFVLANAATPLTVKDEGSTLSAAVTSLDLVGRGVAGSGTTAVTVTIPADAGTTPDSYPATPNAADDEWDGGSLDTTGARFSGATAWAWQNQGTGVATLTRGDLNLVAASGGGGTMNARYILQTAPAGDWTYEAKITILGTRTSSSWSFAGLALRESATGKANIIGVGDDTGVKAQIRRLTGDTTWTANPYTSSTDDILNFRTFYAKVSRSGSTISWTSGLTGSYYPSALYSAAQTSDFTTAPNQVGLMVSAPVSGPVVLICHWFRRTA